MTVATELTIRVSVPDVWDTVLLRVAPHWTIARVKREALDVAMGRHVEADLYLAKFRGGRVIDESATLEALGVPDHGALIVLPERRLPVR